MLTLDAPVVEWRGEVARLMNRLEDYVGEPTVLEELVEGPRGTGKSRGVAFLLYELARRYENARILVIRKTRESLTESFCKVFEEDTCPGDSCIGEGDRISRHHYQFDNGSRIVLGGLDKPTKHQSTDWDVIFCEEAAELTWKAVEPFFGALRNWHMPFQLMLYACNPDAPTHWLNKRANAGKAIRHRTYHLDNPLLYDYDEATGIYTVTGEGIAFTRQSLSKYTGVQHERHVLGLWRGAEGMVWENFDEKIHVIDWPEWRHEAGIVEYRGAMDWGSTHPGCFQVWGIDNEKRMLLVATIQQTGKTPDWWSARACEFVKEFQIRRVVCDPSQPGMMLQFNDWLAARGQNRIAYPANNKKASGGSGDMGGLALVRWGFERDEAGTPRIRMLRNAMRGPADSKLVEKDAPTWVAEEVPGYVHQRDATGEYIFETTDKDLPDDGCDTMRYAATDNWGLQPQAPPEPEPYVYPEWTNAGRFGTPRDLAIQAARREAGEDDFDG